MLRRSVAKIYFVGGTNMQDFFYNNYTRILFGKNAEEGLGAQATDFSKAKRALLVYGSDRVKKRRLAGPCGSGAESRRL